MADTTANVPKGLRNQALRDAAFQMMSEQMGKYTDRNLFEKWTRLLAMVREVRRAGIRPGEDGAATSMPSHGGRS